MELDPLSKIAQECLCEKFTNCGYTGIYHELFKDFRNEVFNLFEIGIYHGASMRMWEKYFPLAQIFAIDTDSRCMKESSDRVHTFYVNQCDKPRLRELMDYIGKCRIICDDGSHEASDMVASLEVLYPYVEDKGYYIVEDILPEAKDEVYGYIKTLPCQIVARGVAKSHPEIDMVILKKCSTT